jgi:hypothetical protein
MRVRVILVINRLFRLIRVILVISVKVDFTLNNGPSCPGKVVRVVFTEWSELT